MILLKQLRWDNVFSYGKGNVINFNEHPIVQLVGKNGHGKSSIPLILEEVLYNKNSKGIKKADILNRYFEGNSYSIELDFENDGIPYTVKTVRGSTQTVRLFRNGEDISAHTSTNTFKLIEEIIGFDARTFSQLIYQSSTSSLEFLTATDTQRKKFLIDLLGLQKYLNIFESVKDSIKELYTEIEVVKGQITSSEAWVEKNSKIDFNKQEEIVVPEQPIEDQNTIAELKVKLKDIDSINKRITKNNEYKRYLKALPIESISQADISLKDTKAISQLIGENNTFISLTNKTIKENKNKSGTCPTCGQSVDISTNLHILEVADKRLIDLKTEEQRLLGVLSEYENHNADVRRIQKIKEDFENYHSLIDTSLPEDLLDGTRIEGEINLLDLSVNKTIKSIKEAQDYNAKVQAHNIKIEVVQEQLKDMLGTLEGEKEYLRKLVARNANLQILHKSFSTNGLIAYKIEGLVQDLEVFTNEYLGDLSDGRFQLSFQVVGEKLNVIITDTGKDIDIIALSTGERARVNTAALLAIRKLMQHLSSTRVNLLILDETIESLDIDGKEKLIEILMKEAYLNTVLVSHGYTHPLLERVSVVKENNISRLE